MNQFWEGLKVLGVLDANFMSHFYQQSGEVNSRFNQKYMIKRLMILDLHTPADTYLP